MRRLLLSIVLIGAAAWYVASRLESPDIEAGSYVLLDLGGDYPEAPPQDLLGRVLHRRVVTLFDLLTTLRKAARDERVAGVLLRVRPLDIGWAKAQEIRDALLEFRKSNKPLTALMEHEMAGANLEYFVASAAERLYLAPNAAAPVTGLAAHFLFFGGVWEKIDVEMNVEKIREYKSFGDMIAGKEMSPAHREMANALLDEVEAQFVGAVAQARHMEAEAVRRVIDTCPISAAEAQAAGLADGARHLEDLEAELGEKTPVVEAEEYAAVSPRAVGLQTGPSIAVVYAVGNIVTGSSGTGPTGEVLGADTVSRALADAATDDDIRAILLRVDSPGGSALASDIVWRATQAARKKKPLVVSMSDVAASGGYYLAAGADRVVAQPATFTGSIGVVFARPYLRRLLAKLGIATETLRRGTFAALDDVTLPLSPEGRRKILAEMEFVYRIFVERVASGRKLAPEEVERNARGRVWTGSQARAHGLVDELGGFAAAIAAAKRLAGIEAAAEVKVVFYPRQQGIVERLSHWVELWARYELPAELRAALRALGTGLAESGVLTHAPADIRIR